MISIVKPRKNDVELLAHIGKLSFIESHGHSAAPQDINEYANNNYTREVFMKELDSQKNIYHIIYYDNRPAGYSKIIFNISHSTIPVKNATKLERLYLLEEFYGLGLGFELLQFNIDLSKMQNQAGMWLFVWKENKRAFRFYEKHGFVITGSHDFKLTETHSNPNYQMFLPY